MAAPHDPTDIYECITGRVVGHWNPKLQTVEELMAIISQAARFCRYSIDVDAMPSLPPPDGLEDAVWVLDHRGMCLTYENGTPIHIDALRERRDRANAVRQRARERGMSRGEITDLLGQGLDAAELRVRTPVLRVVE